MSWEWECVDHDGLERAIWEGGLGTIGDLRRSRANGCLLFAMDVTY